MMNKIYVKSSVWDFLLVALIASALTYTLLDGFNVADSLHYSALPAIACVVCLLGLYVLGQNKKSLLVGSVIYAVALVVAWVFCAALTPGGEVFVDNENNYLIFGMVATLTPTLSYILTRSRAGAAIVFIVGAFIVGAIQLFYQQFEIIWTLVFVIAAVALLIYRNYQLSARQAMGVQNVSFAPGALTALVAAFVVSGVSTLIWFGVIAPLNPQAAKIELITEYRSLETLQVRGTSDEYQRPETDLTSDVTNDGVRTTDDIKEDINGTPWPATGEEESQPEDQQNTGSAESMANDEDDITLEARPEGFPLLLIPLLLIAAIVAYFILRRTRRTAKLQRYQVQGPDKEFEQVFLDLMRKYKVLGVQVPEGQTIAEFGKSSENATRIFDNVSRTQFKNLAQTYSNLVYGKRSVDDQDLRSVERYYTNFWKAARRQLGNVKYFFTSFKLN